MSEEIVDMEEAEEKVKEVAKKRVKEGEVTDVDIESTELIETNKGMLIYQIDGYALYIVGRRGVNGKKLFKAQVHATSGKVIGFQEVSGEEIT